MYCNELLDFHSILFFSAFPLFVAIYAFTSMAQVKTISVASLL